MPRIAIAVLVAVICGTSSHAADVALIRATLSLEGHPTSGIDTYYQAVKRGLDLNAVEYDIVTDEQIVAGALADYRLAIFPYTLDTTPEHTQAILDYVEGGGNVMWFFSVPSALQETLGIRALTYRRNEYEGQLHTMDFTDDAPPGFPEEVRQESKSAQVATALTDDARVIADWLDFEGNSTGTPAVVLTDHSLWVAHVMWPDADTTAQHHLLLATIGHFVPGAWERMVARAIDGALLDAGYGNMDAFVNDMRGGPLAEPLSLEARRLAESARAALAEEQYSEALASAQEVQSVVQRARAACFPSRPFEMRGAWMGFPGDDIDWEAIMTELEAANFNAVFPNMCSPGASAYPSDVLPQVTERDHLTECIEAAHAHGIEVHPWRANWQVIRAAEGVIDRFFDEGRFVVAVEQAMGEEELDQRYVWSRRWLDPSDERNRQLEVAAMEEMARNFDVDGIHYDFMRYPSSRYCYCDRCREQFEEWAGVTVEDWPSDCWEGGKHLAAYRDWRRHLQTSLVTEMRERLAAIDPKLQISLAARASVTGAPESDAQDWITWSREGSLDFLCPMNYSAEVEVFRAKLEPQMELVGGTIPVYAGIGVSPTRSATPVNLSQQIALARELGADGFLIFSLTGFSRAMLPAVAGGVTSEPVDLMPHHPQSASAFFEYPPVPEGAPERTYAPGTAVEVSVRVSALGANVRQLTAQPLVMPARGGEPDALADYQVTEAATSEFPMVIPPVPGKYSLIVRGEVVYDDGHEEPFYLRSQPITVLYERAHAALLARLAPPQFTTGGVRAGVAVRGYGSEGILQALTAASGIEAAAVHRLTPEFLAPCEVLVLPQARADGPQIGDAEREALRAFVRDGGGLLVTHDAVGIRGYEPLFLEVAGGAGEPLRETEVTVAAEHPITAGLTVGQTFAHSYYDHIPLISGEAGVTLVANSQGQAVVVCGDVGEGRYVAWGMATGLGSGDREVRPQGAEQTLLVNAVRWLSQSQE